MAGVNTTLIDAIKARLNDIEEISLLHSYTDNVFGQRLLQNNRILVVIVGCHYTEIGNIIVRNDHLRIQGVFDDSKIIPVSDPNLFDILEYEIAHWVAASTHKNRA